MAKLNHEKKFSVLVTKIKPYPILAGSAVFLGVDHELCDDIDMVRYVFVGTTRDERRDVARELRKLVRDLRPTSVEASLNNLVNTKPVPTRSATGNEKIQDLLNQLVGNDPDSPDPERLASLAWVQLVWSTKSIGLNKQVSLQLHFAHRAFADKDVHPYQEMHECNTEEFVHTNKPWLAPSFLNYFGFLTRAVSEQTTANKTIKAAKRAVIFFGFVGDIVAQTELHRLLDAYQSLDDDGKRQSRERMITMIGELRKVVANVTSSAESM